MVGRHAALGARGRGRSIGRCTSFRPWRPAASIWATALVVLEEGAEATLLAETAGTDRRPPACTAGPIELLVGPDARLRYVNLQNWGVGVWHFAHQKALVDRDGSLQWTIGALGSRLAKVNQHVALVGAGAEARSTA